MSEVVSTGLLPWTLTDSFTLTYWKEKLNYPRDFRGLLFKIYLHKKPKLHVYIPNDLEYEKKGISFFFDNLTRYTVHYLQKSKPSLIDKSEKNLV